MIFSREGHLYYLRTTYSSGALWKLSRQIPGMVRKDSRTWVMYEDTAHILREEMQKQGLRFDDTAILPPGPAKNESFLGGHFSTLRIASKGLRKYQSAGVDFLLANGPQGCILADEMGLGKTVQALVATRALKRKTVIVTHSYVKGVWYNDSDGGQIRKWWPDAEKMLFLPSGTGKNKDLFIPPEKQIVLIHIDILSAWVDAIVAWGPEVIIFDEGHDYLQNEKSLVCTAAKKISLQCRWRWVLTGTPLTNQPRGLFALTDVISPNRFGDNFFLFGVRYCNGHQVTIETVPPKTVWDFRGSSNEEELKRRLDHFVLRRTVDDVGLELPPKTRETIWLESKKSKPAICSTSNRRALREALDRSADVKMPDVLRLLLGHGRQGAKVVVACWRRAVTEWLADGLKKEGFGAEVVHGGVGATLRRQRIERCKAAPGAHFLLTTIDSAALGVDFSFCNVGVFAEFTWEPHEILQWEARLHRFGQARPVLIQFVAAKRTSDELIVEAVVKKLDLFSRVVGKRGGKDLKESFETSSEDALKEIYQMVEEMQRGI